MLEYAILASGFRPRGLCTHKICNSFEILWGQESLAHVWPRRELRGQNSAHRGIGVCPHMAANCCVHVAAFAITTAVYGFAHSSRNQTQSSLKGLFWINGNES